MGNYKDQQKRQEKKKTEQAAQTNGGIAGSCTAEAVKTKTALNEGEKDTVAPVAPVAPVSGSTTTFHGMNPRPTLSADASNEAQRPPNVLAGVGHQASATPPAADTPTATPSNHTLVATANPDTATPTPHRHGRPPGSKNRPKSPPTLGLVLPASGTASATDLDTQTTTAPATPGQQLVPGFSSGPGPAAARPRSQLSPMTQIFALALASIRARESDRQAQAGIVDTSPRVITRRREDDEEEIGRE